MSEFTDFGNSVALLIIKFKHRLWQKRSRHNDLNLASDLQSPRLRTVPQGSRKVFRQGSDFPKRMFQVCSNGRADEAHQ